MPGADWIPGNTQKKIFQRCLDTVNNVANATPIVVPAKGVVHQMAGDSEGGNRALNAADRVALVIGSGAGGLGAIPTGIAAGVGYDAVATAVGKFPVNDN